MPKNTNEFAKLFDLDDYQVLVFITHNPRHDEEYKVIIRTDIENVEVTADITFSDYNSARDYMINFKKNNAEKFRDQLQKDLIGNDQ